MTDPWRRAVPSLPPPRAVLCRVPYQPCPTDMISNGVDVPKISPNERKLTSRTFEIDRDCYYSSAKGHAKIAVSSSSG